MTALTHNAFKGLVVGTALVAATTVWIPRPAQAATSSADILAAVGAIVGVLLLDSNNHPYYVTNNRRYYVTQAVANSYRARHKVVVRQAWVPETEYPVARNAGYQVPQQPRTIQRPSNQRNGNQGNGNQGNGNQGNRNQGH
jgi:hypothetical protein